MTNPFTAIPEAVRRWLYVAYAIAGLVVAVLPIWGVSASKAASTLVVVGAAFGFTAASNTGRKFKHGVALEQDGSRFSRDRGAPDVLVDGSDKATS